MEHDLKMKLAESLCKFTDDILIFKSIDSLIMFAYDYVKDNNCSVQYFLHKPTINNFRVMGLESSDGKIFITKYTSRYSKFTQLVDRNISLIDFINKQLMVLL